jgi:hypothetical protein
VITPRELELARQAAAKIPRSAPKPERKTNIAPGRGRPEVDALMEKANQTYEKARPNGASLAMVELQFGLVLNSLKNWRRRQMLKGNKSVNRIYRDLRQTI